MEAKVKEEVPDKDYNQTQSVERRKPPSSGKERRSPEQEESRSSPALTAPAPPSPHNNGTNESSSPPLNEARGALQRLKRFLSALQQFAADVSGDAGERVKHHIYSLVSGSSSIEEFQSSVQECTNYPLRASVPGFLRALLPHAQRDLTARARAAKMAPLQYIRAHEYLILEPGGDSADIFSSQTNASLEPGVKRRASDPFYDSAIPQTNGTHHGVMDAMEYAPAPKRPHGPSPFLHPSPFLCPPLLPTNSSLYDYGHYHPAYHAAQTEGAFERRDGGITVRDVSSMNANFSDGRGLSSGGGNLGAFKNDDEWKNINTMLNCILSMVEKTKRALAILQQRGTEPGDSGDIKRAANEIMAAAVRQTEERVAEVRRRAEDAVNQVKRQALVDLQRAVGAAEARALELVAAERSKVERLLLERRHTPPGSPSPGPAAAAAPQPQPPPPPPPVPVAQQNCCWNCGRKAQETCSGCNAARYCGAFCQHKDWEHHHQVCSGREQKPNTVLTTSPPITQTTTLSKTTRATTPITGSSENRLSLTTLNNAERMLSSNQERNIAAGNTERIALATLSTAQSLMGSLGGKK